LFKNKLRKCRAKQAICETNFKGVIHKKEALTCRYYQRSYNDIGPILPSGAFIYKQSGILSDAAFEKVRI
jgi:hypothetical protein